MHEVLHHKRKRRAGLVRGADNRFARFVDFVVYPVGIAGIAFAFPQIYEVWVNQNASGISVVTWTAWSCFSLVWVAYGVIHKTPPIVFLNCAWFFVNASVALGAYLHG